MLSGHDFEESQNGNELVEAFTGDESKPQQGQ